MDNKAIYDFYSRKEIQKIIVKSAEDREVGVVYGEKGFGKRPDIIEYTNDVLTLASEGVTSFHISEERWADPLQLKPGMTRQQLDNLRKGWDLIIDIDGKNFEYSKITCKLIVDAINFHNIKNISLKFSGNKGFHIGVQAESFPKIVNDVPTELLFPEGPKNIASYLKSLIEQHLKKELNTSMPFTLVDIDAILISSRHLFRAPYSINEKSNLVSLPLKWQHLDDFNRNDADMSCVTTNVSFLSQHTKNEASQLFIQAFDWASKFKQPKEDRNINQNINFIKHALPENVFPPCIRKLKEGIKEDGRKRAMFILMNYLASIGWSFQEIESFIFEWNKRNNQPLKQGYVQTQLQWFKKQKTPKLPPNCDHPSYYKGMGYCFPDELCRIIKNPVQYSAKKSKFK